MVELYGHSRSRRDIAERMGALSQVAGVRLVTLGDGVERGVRMLEFRTGTGLRFTALIDRALDIADCEYRGQAIGWHSPTGFRNPALHDYEGESGLAWARSFSGLLVTCGLDHTLHPGEVPADNYSYPSRKSVRHSLHGRISTIPARLTGYGESWEGDRCVLWAEGIVQQAAVFAENLHMHRRIEVDVGGNEIRLFDRVVNNGFDPTPHMFFYHINLGYPLLDKTSRYVAPIEDVVWASHAGESYEAQGVGYQYVPEPIKGFKEQVWQHELAADKFGEVPVALINDSLGLGFLVTTRKSELPCSFQWQNFQAGNYVLGTEPSTHHVLGDIAARERGEMIWLDHGEARSYTTRFRILDGFEDISTAQSTIHSIARQPEDPFPILSGNFQKLSNRSVPPAGVVKRV